MPKPKFNITSAKYHFHPLPLSIKKRIKTRASLKRMKRQFNNAFGQHKTSLRVGDYVQVVSGKDAKENKQGKIQNIFRSTGFVVVEDVSMRKRLIKRPGKKPEVLERPGKIHISNVMLVDPEDGKPCKISFKFTEEGEKLRISKRSGSVIPWPEKEEEEVKEANERTDTEPDVVEAKTFREEELLALKNKYLRAFELHYYKSLQKSYEEEEFKRNLKDFKDLLFQYDVVQRAKEIGLTSRKRSEKLEQL